MKKEFEKFSRFVDSWAEQYEREFLIKLKNFQTKRELEEKARKKNKGE